MSWESLKPEAILATVVAVGGVVWKVISMQFSLLRRVEATEKGLDSLKRDVDQQYRSLRDEIKESAKEASQRQTRIEEKLDRLIERGMR